MAGNAGFHTFLMRDKRTNAGDGSTLLSRVLAFLMCLLAPISLNAFFCAKFFPHPLYPSEADHHLWRELPWGLFFTRFEVPAICCILPWVLLALPVFKWRQFVPAMLWCFFLLAFTSIVWVIGLIVSFPKIEPAG